MDNPDMPTEAVTPDQREPLRLDQFLKIVGLTMTGGQAKILIQSGQVTLNGQVETRRRKQLAPGDVVETLGEKFIVEPSSLGE